MTIRKMQDEILKLKQKNDVCILAHTYERQEITEIADYTGDSYALACKGKDAPQGTILMCGVRFMAETVKILAPEKRVLLSEGSAGCPMAQQLDAERLKALQAAHPNAVTAAYVNTTASLKALCDVCVTSSSAIKVFSRLKEREILFVPDCHLGKYVADRLPEKQFYFFEGGCPVHLKATARDVARAREEHPLALLLVHPECREEVTSSADFVGSTSEIMRFAEESGAEEFIIGTDNSVAEHLTYAQPQKLFYPLSGELCCADMRLTTLPSVFKAVRGGGEEICLDERTRLSAKRCLDRMIELAK